MARMILPFAAHVATLHTRQAGFHRHCPITPHQMWPMRHVRRDVR
jgi:hypothetical protein